MEMEVICISSDDESDSQKENKTDKVLMKSAEINNGAFLAHEETELLNVNDKIEENNLKRKIMHTKKEITCSIEKRKKLDVDQDKSEVISKPGVRSIDVLPEIYFVESNYNEQPNKDQEIRTQLIVKEKKKISYISQDVFPLFISLCLQKCPKQDKSEMAIIVDKLKRRYENLDLIYARSDNFVVFLNEKRQAITNDNKKIYVHIQEVMNEMKKRAKKKSQTSQINEIYDAVPSTSYAIDNVSINAVKSDNDNDSDNDSDSEDDNNEENLETRRKVKKILHAMKKCDAVIKKLEEAEVDFNEENDSNYIKVERYKQKMIELYDKLCELTGENADAGRTYLRPKHLNVTRIVAVDQAITNFINCKITQRNRLKKKGSLTDNLIFPDYSDILECVDRCNKKRNLGLNSNKQKQMAERAFKELGEYLQRSRRNDYWDTFSLYLENSEDPATKDKDLAKKLADNRTEGEKRLAAVFEKYTKKQMELRDQNNEGTISEEEEDEDEDEDENENEDEEIELEIENISYEDKSDDILSISSEEDNEKEENADKTVKINELPMEKNKPNINVINIHRAMDISNKIIANTLPEKCNKTVEIKVIKESNMAVSNKNKTISEKIIQKPYSNNTIPRNVTNLDKSCSSNTIPTNVVADVDKPCSSNTVSKNVVTDVIKPCSSKTIPRNVMIDVDKSCSSNTIKRNVMTDMDKPCSSDTIKRNVVTDVDKLRSSNTISTNVVTNVNKSCSSNTIPRNVMTDVDKPCSSNTIPTNVVTDVIKPCSSKAIPRNVMTDVDKPCSSNTIKRNVVTDMDKPCSSDTIKRNGVTDVDKLCSSNTIPTNVVTNMNKPCSSNTIPRNVVTYVNKPCSSNTILRNVVADVDKTCSSNTISKNVTDVIKPCSSKTIPRNVMTDVDKPCSSNTIKRNVVTDVNKPCSSNTILRNVVADVNKPCSSSTISRNVVTDMDIISKKIAHEPCSNSSTIPRNNVKNVDITSEKVYKPCNSNTIPRNDVKNVVVTTSEKIHKPCNITSRNLMNDIKDVVDNKRQEDSLPAASTSNYTKDLAEAKAKGESKVMTDPARKKDVAAMVTSMENTAEVVTENVMDEATENMPNNEQPEEKKKPLLRVRSFAKPPRTWQDNQHKTDKTAQKNAPKVANQIKEIVDLTNEGTVKPVATKCAVQFGNKLLPLKHHTVTFIPSSSNIINVKNITNNYLKVNTRTGEIIAPVHDIRTGATIIRLPVQTTSQSQLQNTNVTNESLKGKKILKIVPKKTIILPKPSAVQSVSKQTDVSSLTTQSK